MHGWWDSFGPGEPGDKILVELEALHTTLHGIVDGEQSQVVTVAMPNEASTSGIQGAGACGGGPTKLSRSGIACWPTGWSERAAGIAGSAEGCRGGK